MPACENQKSRISNSIRAEFHDMINLMSQLFNYGIMVTLTLSLSYCNSHLTTNCVLTFPLGSSVSMKMSVSHEYLIN
jgi:hypothetical protein